MSSPCHIELILAEREKAVPRPTSGGDDEPVKKKKVSQKKLKRQKMMMRD